ncbi:MAG: biotin--[acetyl-CoA-carboxylase] ligase, partial [Bacteroides sp.]
MIYAKPISTEWIHLEETESTNTFLHNRLEQANDNEAELIIVSTDYQTTGRGQRGNHWEAERAKNLLFSLLLHPTFVPIRQQ